MSRNIVEFGFGHYSTSRPEAGDRLLAAEPLVPLHSEVEMYPYLDFFSLDEIAVMGYDGECDIHYNPSDILHSTCDPADLPTKEFGDIKRVNCLTLDSWLARYAEQGFTERIDIMNVVLNSNADVIFDCFSFNPRPEFIIIGQPGYPDKTVRKMREIGYRVYDAGSKVVGIDI